MTTRSYQMPRALQPLIDAEGRPSRVWHEYLAGIEDTSGRVAAAMADLTAPPTQADFNNLLALLRAATMMRRS